MVHLPVAGIDSSITKSDDAYILHLTSKTLARGAGTRFFGNLDVKLSDNFVDLVPGEAQEIPDIGEASLEDLHSNAEGDLPGRCFCT